MALNYQSPSSGSGLAQTRLTILGVSLLVLGAAFTSVGVAVLLPTYAGNEWAALFNHARYVKLPSPHWSLNPFLTLASIGTVCIWSGVGSLRRQRWTRPVVLSFAGIVIF